MKKIILPLLFMTTNLLGQTQYTTSIQNKWFGENNFILEFGASEVACKQFEYFESYQIFKDTLTIIHNSRNTHYILDRNAKRMECSSCEHNNSKFLILNLDATKLELLPLNAWALKNINEISSPVMGFYFDHYESTLKKKLSVLAQQTSSKISEIKVPDSSLEPFFDTLKLKNMQSMYQKIKWDSISISFEEIGHFKTSYLDLKLFPSGKCYIFRETHNYQKENNKSANKIKTSKLNKSELNSINTRIDSLGLSYWTSTRTYFRSSSHATNCRLRIYFNGEYKEFKDHLQYLPKPLLPLANNLKDLSEKSENRLHNGPILFETSFIDEEKIGIPLSPR